MRGSVTDGCFATADGAVRVATTAGDGAALLVVRPEAVGLAPDGDLEAVVGASRFAGSDVLVDTTLPDGQALRVRVPVGSRIAVGDRLRLRLDPERCTVFEAGVTT